MYKVKRFSIQSGRPDKSASLKRELANKVGVGSVIGGITGLIAGGIHGGIQYATRKAGEKVAEVGMEVGMSGKDAFLLAGGITIGSIAIGAITGALSAMGADGRRSKATKINMSQVLDNLDVMVRDYEKSTNTSDINIFRYIETDKNPKDYQLTMAYEDGCAIMLIKNPTHELLACLNEQLENMVKFNRKADYVAEEVKDGYVVYATIPSVESICGLIYQVIYDCRIKINCLTEKKIQL